MTKDKLPEYRIEFDVFAKLVERYGPDLSTWPPFERESFAVFARTSQEAQKLLQEETALNALLDKASEGEVHAALTARILATAPGARADGRAATAAGAGWLGGLVGVLWPRFGWVRPAALMGLSLVAGLYVGLTAPTQNIDTQDTDLFAYVFEIPETWDTGEWQ